MLTGDKLTHTTVVEYSFTFMVFSFLLFITRTSG